MRHAVRSTAVDFVFEMFGGPERVLSKDELQQNFQRVIVANAELDSGYGIGFEVHRVGAHVFLGHAGGVYGYSAYAYFEPAAQVGIVILHNGMDVKTLFNLRDMFFHWSEVKD